MNHEEIEEQNITERYLLHQLSAAQSALFEEHFVDCPVCLDRLEDAERFRSALKPLANELAQPAAMPGRRTVWPRAAMALAAVLLAGLFVARDVNLRSELEASRASATAWRERFQDEKNKRSQFIATPHAAATFFLSSTRGQESADSDPVNPVKLPTGIDWVVLALEAEQPQPGTLRAKLLDAGGRGIWSVSGLQTGPRQALSVIVPASILAVGNYTLTLERLSPAGAYQPAGSFRFVVLSAP